MNDPKTLEIATEIHAVMVSAAVKSDPRTICPAFENERSSVREAFSACAEWHLAKLEDASNQLAADNERLRLSVENNESDRNQLIAMLERQASEINALRAKLEAPLDTIWLE